MQAPNIQLALVGGKGWKNQALMSRIADHPYQKQINLVGWVTDEQLPHLLAGAEALLYPSLYEGFGLPPVESIAVGTPVVASSTSAIPEVMGKYSLYADPLQIDDWVRQIQFVVGNSQYRAWIRSHGSQWVARYSEAVLTDNWERFLNLIL